MVAIQDQVIKAARSPFLLSLNPNDPGRIYVPGTPLAPPTIPSGIEQRIISVANQTGVRIAANAFTVTEQPTVEISFGNTVSPDLVALRSGRPIVKGSTTIPYTRTFRATSTTTTIAAATTEIGNGAAADIAGSRLWAVDTMSGVNHTELTRVPILGGPTAATEWSLDANLAVVNHVDNTNNKILRLYVPDLVDANGAFRRDAEVGELMYVQPLVIVPSFGMV